MPTNTINVVLNASNELNVQDHGKQNEVEKSQQATTITWNLTGGLAQGNFLPMSNPVGSRGFEWVQTPPTGVFTDAVIGSNGNSVSITDTHPDATTDGRWIYVLRVNLDGTTYCTTSSTPTATVNNPVIINR
jgi:hypothetical protein